MKISYTGLDLPEGKVKYEDPVVIELAEKFMPDKVSPYYCTFAENDHESAGAIVIAREKLLDLLIGDMEKLEKRRERTADPGETGLILRALAELEKEIPLCDMPASNEERDSLKKLNLLSAKPTIVIGGWDAADVKGIIREALDRAGLMFFYTAGKQEVRAWIINKGDNAEACAAEIHTTIAKGFVKAEIIPVEDMLKCHSMQDARQKGLTLLVDRGFVIQADTVLEIHSSLQKH